METPPSMTFTAFPSSTMYCTLAISLEVLDSGWVFHLEKTASFTSIEIDLTETPLEIGWKRTSEGMVSPAAKDLCGIRIEYIIFSGHVFYDSIPLMSQQEQFDCDTN